jgi:hypothetical protein
MTATRTVAALLAAIVVSTVIGCGSGWRGLVIRDEAGHRYEITAEEVFSDTLHYSRRIEPARQLEVALVGIDPDVLFFVAWLEPIPGDSKPGAVRAQRWGEGRGSAFSGAIDCAHTVARRDTMWLTSGCYPDSGRRFEEIEVLGRMWRR